MKKGFTLIELLAVIVILAIIAIIAVPIILGIINDAKKESNERSAELYLKAAELAIARKNLSSELGDTECTTQSNGNLICTGVEGEISVDIDGVKPEAGSKITFSNGKITEVKKLKVGETTYKLDNGSLVVYDPANDLPTCIDTAVAGSVQLGNTGEYFYKIAEENGYSYYLAKYNLLAGKEVIDINMSNSTAIFGETFNTAKQNSCARGLLMTSGGAPDFSNGSWYGTITFTSGEYPYWLDETTGEYKEKYEGNGNYPEISFVEKEEDNYTYVYDNDSNLYPYMEQYKSYLMSKDSSLNIVDVRPIAYEEFNEIYEDENLYLFNTSYWMGSFQGDETYAPSSFGMPIEILFYIDGFVGMRPLVVVQD